MNTFIIITFTVIFIFWFIRRYIYNPGFTDRALDQFIIDTVRSKSFEEISRDTEVQYIFDGRQTKAHWIVHRTEMYPLGFIIEFDVHPSTNGLLTISRSKFLLINNQAHFDRMKEELLRGEYHSFEFLYHQYFNSETCPQCNSLIKVNENVCSNCGMKLVQVEKGFSNYKEEFEFYCSNCNSIVDADDVFCKVCHSPLTEN